MKFSSTCIAVAAAYLPQLISAHMRITDPAPYNGENNAPLAADGSNFPCMMTGAAPQMAAGKTYTAGQTGSFKVVGGATHGGGSCQVSITYDKVPTKKSKFKVLKSYIGGCPVASNTENQSSDRNDQSIPDFNFKMPSGLPSGDAVFVWTWFNRIGNREMYMNCAPIKIIGNGQDTSVFDALPDMFKANIGDEGTCTTTEVQDIIFPDENIGKNVRTGAGTCNFKPACEGKGTYSFKPGQPGEETEDDAAPGGGSSSSGSYAAPQPAPTGSYSMPSSPALVDTGKNNGSPVNSAPSSQYTPINGGGSSSSDSSSGSGSGSYGGSAGAAPIPSQPSTGGSYNSGSGSQPSTPSTPSPPASGGSSYTGSSSSSASPTADDNTGMLLGQYCDGSSTVVCNSNAPQGHFIECYGANPYGKQMGFAQPIPAGYASCEDLKTKCGASATGSSTNKFKRHAYEHTKRFARRHLH